MILKFLQQNANNRVEYLFLYFLKNTNFNHSKSVNATLKLLFSYIPTKKKDKSLQCKLSKAEIEYLEFLLKNHDFCDITIIYKSGVNYLQRIK